MKNIKIHKYLMENENAVTISITLRINGTNKIDRDRNKFKHKLKIVAKPQQTDRKTHTNR